MSWPFFTQHHRKQNEEKCNCSFRKCLASFGGLTLLLQLTSIVRLSSPFFIHYLSLDCHISVVTRLIRLCMLPLHFRITCTTPQHHVSAIEFEFEKFLIDRVSCDHFQLSMRFTRTAPVMWALFSNIVAKSAGVELALNSNNTKQYLKKKYIQKIWFQTLSRGMSLHSALFA